MAYLILLFLAAANPAAAPSAAPGAQCGPKPFLLNKPIPHHAPANSSETQQKAATAALEKPTTKPVAKPKAKPLADCDKPRKG